MHTALCVCVYVLGYDLKWQISCYEFFGPEAWETLQYAILLSVLGINCWVCFNVILSSCFSPLMLKCMVRCNQHSIAWKVFSLVLPPGAFVPGYASSFLTKPVLWKRWMLFNSREYLIFLWNSHFLFHLMIVLIE